MSNQQDVVDHEELKKRTRAIRDAASMSPYIPDELRTRLETGLSDEMRTAVLELQILAIKFGRALERRDVEECRPLLLHAGKQPSNLALKLVGKVGQQVHKVNEEKKIDILVAPGFLDLSKKESNSTH